MKQIARTVWVAIGFLSILISASVNAQQPVARPADPFGGDARAPAFLGARKLPRPPIFDAPNAVLDRSAVKAGPITVESDSERVTVRWPDEKGRNGRRYSL